MRPMEYHVRYKRWGIPKYGLMSGGSIAVEGTIVVFSGFKARLVPVLSVLGVGVGMTLAATLVPLERFDRFWTYNLIVLIIVVGFWLVESRWRLFTGSIAIRKNLVTEVVRYGNEITFSLPDPTDTSRQVRAAFRIDTEEEALRLEMELRT
jgi:hypothetical protein